MKCWEDSCEQPAVARLSTGDGQLDKVPACRDAIDETPVGAENIRKYDEWYRRERAEFMAALDES